MRSGICHEDGLVQAEDRNGEEIADEQERLHECEGKGGEEDGEKDVEHSLLRVLCADLDDLLLSATDAFSAPSRWMLALMNSTARYAPVETACVEAPANQKMIAPPQINPSMKGACNRERLPTYRGSNPWVTARMMEKVMWLRRRRLCR